MQVSTLVSVEAPLEELLDPEVSAEAAGLRYVSDDRPGITRIKQGDSFEYRKPNGDRVTDERTLARIKALAIPPAWTEVWICPTANGHLQATGRDAKGRKQYRYHPKWREVRDAVKYDKLLAFAEALPRIRQRVDHDLALPGLPREKVLAAVVRLLEETRMRVGNEEYKKQNESFGLTTLQNRHVKVQGSKVRFHFKGKHGKVHDVELSDRRLARIVQRCRDIPGQDLFQYIDDDGERRDVTSGDVNAYIREIASEEFTAKDFRTWAGSLLATRFFHACEPCASAAEGKRMIVRCIELVAQELGNTVAVCRKCYVHPRVLDAFLAGEYATLDGSTTAARGKRAKPVKNDTDARYALTAEERLLVDLLRAGEAAATAHVQQAKAA